MTKQAKAVLQTETLEAVADRGQFSSTEILACHEAGITVALPKPETSGAKSDGRFGKQDCVYLSEEDAYRCPAGERLRYRHTNEEDGKMLRWDHSITIRPVDGSKNASGCVCFSLASGYLQERL